MKRSNLILALLFVASLFVGCEGQSSDGPSNGDDSSNSSPVGSIALYADKAIIRANGEEEVSFTVLLTDDKGKAHDVTTECEIYLDGENLCVGQTYSSSVEGNFSFYAIHGFSVSNKVSLRAVEGVSELPQDTDAENFAFDHRMLLVQHTGTDCGQCPRMMTNLKLLSEDEAYADKYHHVASHSYSLADKAYTSAAELLSRTVMSGSYPWLTFNLTDRFAHELSEIKSAIDELHQEVASAGIAAATSLVGSEIFVTVGLKSAVDANYRIAVWLLEDNIQATQAGANASWQNLHNNCLREMVGENKMDRIYGAMIPPVKAGEQYELVTALTLEPDWAASSCEVLVLVSAKNEQGDYELVNTALCPIDGTTEYRYN